MAGEDQGGKAPPPFFCPECSTEFAGPRALGLHIERHAPVRAATYDERDKLVSVACSKGCGRHYISRIEVKKHQRLCTGQPPLAPVPIMSTAALDMGAEGATGMQERRVPAVERVQSKEAGNMHKCAECGKEFPRAQALGLHKYRAHGVRAARAGKPGPKRRKGRRAARPARAARAQGSALDGAGLVQQLRVKAAEHRKKADELEGVAAKFQAQMDEMAATIKELF